MRAVFTVDLRRDSPEFPTDSDLLALIRGFGWEPVELTRLPSDNERLGRYTEYASKLFELMPEIANEEKDDVLFYGYVADDQTKLIVTRRVQGQITFRLLHEELPRLQASTEKVVRRVLGSSLGEPGATIANERIDVYERNQNHIIITGRVIPRPLKETIRSNVKDSLLFVVPVLLALPIFVYLSSTTAAQTTATLSHGTLERLSTALLTTSLVSALSLFERYLYIRRNRLIDWTVTKGKVKA